MSTYTDAAQVERLLKSAVAFGTQPDLSAAQVTDMVALALDGDAYSSEAMQRAAVTAWGWKAGLTSDRYDLGGQGGSKITESQWFDHCVMMAERFRLGFLSVDGATLGVGLDADGSGGVFTVRSTFLTGYPVTGSEL